MYVLRFLYGLVFMSAGLALGLAFPDNVYTAVPGGFLLIWGTVAVGRSFPVSVAPRLKPLWVAVRVPPDNDDYGHVVQIHGVFDTEAAARDYVIELGADPDDRMGWRFDVEPYFLNEHLI